MTQHTPIPTNWVSLESADTYQVTETKLRCCWQWDIVGDGASGYVLTDDEGDFIAHSSTLPEPTAAYDLVEAFSLIVGEEVWPANDLWR